jgi:LacI family transcriptional regulator, galactose operon repressor
MKKITVKDIARMCGVSIGSVDRALHDRPGISEKTKRKVLEVCEREGFNFNRFAQSLARKPLRLAAIIPEKGDEFYSIVEQGLLQGAAELKDLNVSLEITKTSTLGHQEEIVLMEHYKSSGVDGLTVCAGHINKLNNTINCLEETGIPVVTMASDAPGSMRSACVAVPPVLNGETAAAYMSRFIHGSGKVAVLVGSMDVVDHKLKADGFIAKLAQLRPDLISGGIIETDEDPERLKKAIRKLSDEPIELKGLYLVTYGGHSCAQELEKLGLADSVVFISTDRYRRLIPYLQSGTIDMLVDQKPFEQGYHAVHLLFDILTGKNVSPEKVYMRPEYIIRESLGFYN